jgi:hypothetical protein
MAIVEALIDLTKLSMTISDWDKFVGDAGQWREVEEYSYHFRDMTQGWGKLGRVLDWKASYGPFEPGTYAFVYDPLNNIKNPITEWGLLNVGETTRPAYKRIVMHQLCLRGKKSNVGDKWQSQASRINTTYGCNILSEIDNISIFFRPHSYSDPNFAESRTHSVTMETQAHAQYAAIFGVMVPANTRDLPSQFQIEESKRFLIEQGYDIANLNKQLT